MKLYDNDAYREEFMALVYNLLYSDGTNDLANQIIDAFDMAPAMEADPFPPNDPLTLEELKEMDGELVWDSILSMYGFVNVRSFNGKGCIQYTDNWINPRCLVPDRYYRRNPEEGTT